MLQIETHADTSSAGGTQMIHNVAPMGFINNIGPMGLIIIAVVVLVLFGRGKISSLMGEVGKGITAFKKGVDDGKKEIEDGLADARDVTPEKEDNDKV
jgi:sec-independent protein translocase protein TatA